MPFAGVLRFRLPRPRFTAPTRIGRDSSSVSPAPGIDHIVLCVRDLEAARDRFVAMGFTLTPPAIHPFGTGNSLAQMGSSFIELLAVTDPERIPPHGDGRFSFAAHNADFLSRREGMSMLVISSEDARADEARWRKAGLKTFEPVYFERAAKLPDGSEAKVAFTIAFVLNEKMPDAIFFCCQQHAPDVFWQPDYQRHRNGALDFSGVTLVAEEPQSHAEFFEQLFGGGSVSADGERLKVRSALGKIQVITPAAVSARFAGNVDQNPGSEARFLAAAVRVTSLDAADRCLERGGIERQREKDRIVIPPRAACGLVLELVES